MCALPSICLQIVKLTKLSITLGKFATPSEGVAPKGLYSFNQKPIIEPSAPKAQFLVPS